MHLVRVKLLGPMGRLFVRELELLANSPRMIIRGLCANFPTMKAYLEKYDFHLVRVKPGESQDYGEEDIEKGVGDYDFVIMPVVAGSGGVLRIVAGIALVAASFFVPFLGTAALSIGLSLAVGGVAQLLSPTPGTPSGENERKDSFLSQSAAAVNKLGDPLPEHFGKRRIRSPIVLSSGLSTEQIPA